MSRAIGFLLVVLLPFPVVLLYVLGVPLSSVSPYAFVYADWFAFAVFLDRVATRGWPERFRLAAARGVRWPHRQIGYAAFGLMLVVFLISRILTNPILIWSAWNALVIVGFLEAAIVGQGRPRAKAVSRNSSSTETKSKDGERRRADSNRRPPD
jgi:hypothetical protein